MKVRKWATNEDEILRFAQNDNNERPYSLSS